MIQDHKAINLFGHLLFEKAILKTPFSRSVPMPNEACFLYILDGRYHAISEEDSFLAEAEEAVLMKCGNYMGHMLSKKSEHRYEAVAVHFYPEVMKKVYADAPPSFLTDTSFTFSRNMVKMEASILIRKYIESLLFYFENPELVSEEILILKLKEIVLLLLQTKNAPQVIEVFNNLFNPRTFTFKEVVEAHIFTSISISELAQLTNLSLSSFKRTFAQVYDDTPARFRTKRRIEKAKQLLALSENSIGHIAFEVGFLDVAHFSKVFKSVAGVSPSTFRLNRTDKKLDRM